MSNALSARRVMFQELDPNGNPMGSPYFGVIVSDSYEADFNNSFDSVKSLNDAIEEKGCIAHLCDKFVSCVDPAKVGTENFYGKNWAYGDEDEHDFEEGEPDAPDAPEITDETIST